MTHVRQRRRRLLSILSIGCLATTLWGCEAVVGAVETTRASRPGPATQTRTPSEPVTPQRGPTEPGSAASSCEPLPPVSGDIILVGPTQATALPALVSSAASGTVIVLQDGHYDIGSSLRFQTPNVTLRSAGGRPTDVVIDGMNGFTGVGTDTRVNEIVVISASNVTIAEVTIQNARDHLVHIVPGTTSTLEVRLRGLKLLDPGEQAIKINPDGSGRYTDAGEIACSHIELTDRARPWVERLDGTACYTGGIDAHASRDWTIRHNTIKGFWCAQGLAEHGVHFWIGSRDTVVEGNKIINSARGIGFGLGRRAPGREYSDGPCHAQVNAGHYGGSIHNNVVLANDDRLFDSAAGFDVGIGLEDACDVDVTHNTIVSTREPFASVDWRFPGTTAAVANNLTSAGMAGRDGATASLTGNQRIPPAGFASHFNSVSGDGDLHLKASATLAIDRGDPDATIPLDRDGRPRGAAPDIGAYER